MVFKTKYPGSFKKQHKFRKKTNQFKQTGASKGHRGSYSVYLKSNYILPNNFVVYLRKYYKKFFKKKKIRFNFKIKVNYTLSSKNKNSRMGKGVGSLNRYAFLKKNTSVIFEVYNINYVRLQLLLNIIYKRFGVKFNIVKI